MYKIAITAFSLEEFKKTEKMLEALGEIACKYACEAKYLPLSFSLMINFRNFGDSKINLPAEGLDEIKHNGDNIEIYYYKKGYMLVFEKAKYLNIIFDQKWQESK